MSITPQPFFPAHIPSTGTDAADFINKLVSSNKISIPRNGVDPKQDLSTFFLKLKELGFKIVSSAVTWYRGDLNNLGTLNSLPNFTNFHGDSILHFTHKNYGDYYFCTESDLYSPFETTIQVYLIVSYVPSSESVSMFYKLRDLFIKLTPDSSKSKKKHKINMIFKRDSGFYTKPAPLKGRVYSEKELDILFPFDGRKEFEDKLHTSTKGIFLLHGDPGTGKSSYIKQLILHTTHTSLYLQNEILTSIGNPSFMKFLLSEGDEEDVTRLLISEDCESTITASDKRDSATSNLLNFSDGLLSDALNSLFLLTFNAPATTIDPALLRPGRLKHMLEFKPLTYNQANSILEMFNKAERLPEDTKTITHANLFSNYLTSI